MNALMKLSDAELEQSMGHHVNNERMSLDQIYQHINEVYRREWHLDSAYGDMRTYLIKRWKYSERDAYRKIDGAKLLREVPALTAEIKSGNLNADVIGELARAVKEKERVSGEKVTAAQKSDLVQMIVGKTAAETQRDLAQALDIQVRKFETKRVQKDNSVDLGLSVSPEIYESLMKCRDHATHKMQQERLPHTLESLLKIFSDLYIKTYKLDVPARLTIETSKEVASSTANLKSTSVELKTNAFENEFEFQSKAGMIGNTGNKTIKKKINKTITPKTRREVFQRDRCCQYKNPTTGQICGSKAFPQVDHKTSVWAGGTNELANLQQLCAAHNQRKYRKEAQLNWLQ